LLLFGRLVSDSPARIRAQAESAARSGQWATALRHWRTINAMSAARSSETQVEEARACLALGRALQAEHSLHQAIASNPADPEAWRFLLEILRVEDRTLEAMHLGWKAYDQVRPNSQQTLLRELTLSLLAELPDDLVRSTLKRWVEA